MALSQERHEEILTSLNDPELTHSDRAELLTELRSDYTGVLDTMTEYEKNTAHLQKEREDLLHANSIYFRQLQSQTNLDNDTPPEQEIKVQSITDLLG